MLTKLYHRLFKTFFSSSAIGVETKKGLKMKNDIEIFIEENSQKFDENLIFDIDLMPHFKKANEGDTDSIQKLAYAFLDGKQTKTNLELAIKYFELLFDTFDDRMYLTRHLILYNLATIEARREDYEKLKFRYYNMIHQMNEEVPLEEWNFEVFKWMKEVADWKNEDSDN